MKITVVTTFNQAGYIKYGKNMLASFIKNWPTDISLVVYAENCIVTEHAPNLIVYDSHTVNDKLVEFKSKWKDVPKANGNISGIVKRSDSHKSFKWDAVRFANKVYAIFHCANNITDKLLWMDADMICHSPITVENIAQLCPDNIDIAFLGRDKKYTECGLYYLNMNSDNTKQFLQLFQSMYDDAENGIFKLIEWHDSFVFDVVRSKMKLNELNWSNSLIVGEGHPLINCEWGKYLDHLKGDRKTHGTSLKKDLIIERNEPYWKGIK